MYSSDVFDGQHGVIDSGFESLIRVCKYYGYLPPKSHQNRLLKDLRKNISLLSLSNASKQLGFKPLTIQTSYDKLLELDFPAIVGWGTNKFIVIADITDRSIYVLDKINRKHRISRNQFEEYVKEVSETNGKNIMILTLSPTSAIPKDNAYLSQSSTGQDFNPKTNFIGKYLQYAAFVFFLIVLVLLPFVINKIADEFYQEGASIYWIPLLIILGLFLISRFLLDYGIINIPSSVNIGTMNSGNRQQSIDVPSGRDNMDALVLNADFVKRCAGIVLVVVLYYFNWVVGLAVSILFGIFLWRENMVRRQIIQLSNINLKSNKRSQIKWYDHTIGKLEIGFFDQVPGSENIINEKNDLSVFLPEELNPIIEKASQSLNRWKEIFLVVGIIGTGFLTYIGMMGFSNWVAVLYIFAMIHLYVQLSRVGIDMSTEVKPLLPDTTFSQRPVLRRAGDIQITKLSFQSSDNEDDDILNLSTRFRKGSSSAIFSEFSSSPITLLKLLGGVVTAPENSIFINRIDITSIDIRAYQERIGYVHQNGYIFSDTIEMNITGPDTITDHKWLQNIIDSVGLRQWVEQLEYGVSTPIGIGGKKLSMAITQRVLIARALYRHPDYLLLENAFCYLDPRSVYRVMKEIRRILPDVTIIAISNVLPVLSFVDGVKFIKNGRLIEEGSHSELMYKRGVYYHSINPLEEVLN